MDLQDGHRVVDCLPADARQAEVGCRLREVFRAAASLAAEGHREEGDMGAALAVVAEADHNSNRHNANRNGGRERPHQQLSPLRKS